MEGDLGFQIDDQGSNRKNKRHRVGHSMHDLTE
jgi:hypothetical protein